MILAISGKAQAGKDTIGQMLAYFFTPRENYNYIDYSTINNWYPCSKWEHKYFALPLKEIISDILGCNIHKLNDNNFKESKIEWLNNMTVRELLQKFGTGIRNTVHSDFWVNLLFNDYYEDSNWIITDVRFNSEVNKIKNLDGIIIRVNRDSAGAGNHISETELDNYKFFDFVITNNGTLEDLFNKVHNLYMNLIENVSSNRS